MAKQTFAIDFDGVICKRNGVPTSKVDWFENDPIEYALDTILLLKKQGHEVFIYSSNKEPEKVSEWLKLHGFPKMDIIWKPKAHVYIDDRAIRFDNNWQSLRKLWS